LLKAGRLNPGGREDDDSTVKLAAAFAATALSLPAPSAPGRPAVFSDQLPDALSPGLVRFAATHYAGAQKLGAAETDALRRVNPRFFAIQYRLALGLGRHTQVRFGDEWVPEWPARVREQWFYHYRGRRLYQRQWGWFVMNTDNASWRAYYLAQVRRQVATTHADGAFLDSASVPNEFGGSSFTPALPDYSPPFEHAWTLKLDRWLPYVQRKLGRPVIVNAGSWVTTRDRTNYSRVAGVMVEGFATGLAPVDWQLELKRALGLIRKGRVVICQSYPAVGDVEARTFDLGSYLLIEGTRTYVNFGEGIQVSWFPEYGLDLGNAIDPPGLRTDQGAFVRRFANGLVVVNPGDATVRYALDGTYELTVPHGGGAVPESGLVSGWGLSGTPVTAVTLGPRRAALLLH
jgi:hypothetical protein